MELKKAIGVNDFLNLKFKEFEFTDDWEQIYGRPERNFKMLIKGPEKNGKTTYSLALCKYLARFSKIYFNSGEEGKSKTLQDAIHRANLTDVAGKIMFLHKETHEEVMFRLSKPNSAKIMVFDSIDYLELKEKHYKELVKAYPNKSFIFLSWTDTKDNPLTPAAKRIAKRVDITILIKDFKGYPTSRFGGNRPFNIADNSPIKREVNPIQTLF